ncbi:MAG: hypothetical protein JJU45_11905 [Acidimicrobiia bacterium]|nr:hypothetical protein [Acidimicrobiia bacterium]
MLFSKDDRAHWDVADRAAKAHVDWLHHCDSADYEANLQRDEALGRARATHLRSAVKSFHAAGEIDDDGKGSFWERTIRRVAAPGS